MDTEKLHEALTRAGLTEYQAAVYLAVLEMGEGPVVDAAERTDVPGSQVYEVVRALEDRGFVETIERDRLHTRAMEPVDVLEELRSTGQLLNDAAEEIEERWESPDSEHHRVSVVKRRATVLDRARASIEEADIAVEVALSVDQFREIRATLEAAAERGVVVHAAVNGPLDGLETELDDSAITEIRHSVTPGPVIVIVDRHRSFVSPNYHHDEEYGVIVDDQILSFMAHWKFLTCVWVPWEPIHETDTVEFAYVSIEDCVHELAASWHDGATITVSVVGRDTDTGERVELDGVIAWMLTGETPTERRPRYERLGGNVALVVDSDGDYVTVGGWGAIYEDVEAAVVRVVDVVPDDRDTDRSAVRRRP